ncbi:MAG: orotate phosphoribosyltransferase [Chitinophagales bacterium]
MDAISEQLAKYLLQIKAIQLSVQKPFTWASGWLSPVYCDNRQILSYPDIRNFVRDSLTSTLEEKFKEVDVIAGVATGGIAVGALVADQLQKPFIYVRSAPKGHGMQKSVEGHVEDGQRVVMIEDLISSGKSSLQAVDAIRRETNTEVVGLIALFTYGFQTANDNFEKSKVPFFTLSNYKTLISVAIKNGYILPEHEDVLNLWRQDPANWGRT